VHYSFQKSPRTATIKKRPTTAVDVAGASEKPYGQLRKPRPSSAATTTGSGNFKGMQNDYLFFLFKPVKPNDDE
jgi:hypothetical protein